jgi:hypothetical protein
MQPEEKPSYFDVEKRMHDLMREIRELIQKFGNLMQFWERLMDYLARCEREMIRVMQECEGRERAMFEAQEYMGREEITSRFHTTPSAPCRIPPRILQLFDMDTLCDQPSRPTPLPSAASSAASSPTDSASSSPQFPISLESSPTTPAAQSKPKYKDQRPSSLVIPGF